MEKATELEFLQWFWENADFGPAHEDVIMIYIEQFEKDTGLEVPKSCKDRYFE